MEIARGGFVTYNRRGIRAVAEEYWHPEVEWQVGPWGVALGGQTHLRGREEAIAAFHELEAIMGHFKNEVLDVLEWRNGVLVEVRVYGKGTGSGASPAAVRELRAPRRPWPRWESARLSSSDPRPWEPRRGRSRCAGQPSPHPPATRRSRSIAAP